MGYGDITVHGFRSTFRDWVAESTEYPDSLAEMALAHAVKSKVIPTPSSISLVSAFTLGRYKTEKEICSPGSDLR
jgi:hypothetical protein